MDKLCLPDSNIELALSGSVWDYLIAQKPEEAHKIAHFVRVIGRCSPLTKITIVDCFNHQGFITLMCGDGGNDCGALRTAHVGLALSDSEASVVSPFTSVEKDIMSVVELLKEGRCTLSAAISSYKYMIIYGQIETILQITSAYFAITVSEWCWVFLDGFWVISMSFSIPFSGVAAKLAPERPTSSILGPHTLASVLGVLVINFLFMVLGLGLLFSEDWFKCRKWEPGSIADVTSLGDNYESSLLFTVMGYQWITSGIAFNFGFQHRASGLLNWRFMFFAIVWTIIHFVVILYPSELSCFFRVNCDNENVVRGATNNEYTPIQNPWNTTLMPVSFRHTILILCIFNGVALIMWEYLVINGPVANYLKSLFPKQNKLLGGVGYVHDSQDELHSAPSVVPEHGVELKP
jgi:cation-transporting ATPase 13A3/4/5